MSRSISALFSTVALRSWNKHPRQNFTKQKLDAKLKSRRGEANRRYKNIYNLSEGLKEVTQGSESASGEGEKDSEWGDLGSNGKEWSSGGREKGEEEDKEGGGIATRYLGGSDASKFFFARYVRATLKYFEEPSL